MRKMMSGQAMRTSRAGRSTRRSWGIEILGLLAIVLIFGLGVVGLGAGSRAEAHTVMPAVADLSEAGGTLTISLRLNAEALLAGIDLDGIDNTDASPLSHDYDALRQADPAAVAAQLRANWDRLAGVIVATTGAQGAALPLQLGDISVSEVGDASQPRPSRLILSAALPRDVDAVRIGWGRGNGTLTLRHVVDDKEGYSGVLQGGETSPAIALNMAAPVPGWRTFADFLPLGFDHILPYGLDHVLFILGLFFLAPQIRPLLAQVTLFTVAHSITLALGVLGLIRAPGSVVEPLIAASIIFVAVENIFVSRMTRVRAGLVFAFGLLHGLGFAGALSQVGIPGGNGFAALAGFNIGVELGQIAVLLIAFLAVGVWTREKLWYRERVLLPASVVIASLGFYWLLDFYVA